MSPRLNTKKTKRKIKIFEALKQSLHDALKYEQGKKVPVRVTEISDPARRH